MTDAKTLEEVYADRNALAMAFAAMVWRRHRAIVQGRIDGDPMDWRAMWDPPNADDADAEEWAIVYVWLGGDQVSWHVPRELAEAAELPRKTAAWDGHHREEKNDRLRQFSEDPHPERDQ